MSTTAQTVPVTQAPSGLQLRDRGLERTALLAIIRPAHADRVARRASEDFEARKVRFADRSRRRIVDGVLRSPGGPLVSACGPRSGPYRTGLEVPVHDVLVEFIGPRKTGVLPAVHDTLTFARACRRLVALKTIGHRVDLGITGEM